MLSHAHTVSPGFALGQSPAALGRLIRRLRAQHVAYKTRRALARLTQRELEDIGVTLADIDRVARRSAGL
ncbi:primosomal protein DnaI [Meridianimarinicoccus roseus]|uniref:Primosomal protein DnaI n=1 Tax=Meridianimarinicoccus roseus TaxID=2072018 RepID=A0A2V2LR44_9RHOB|nr:DUF1127 domain-containing protein [Meridianimarinicoccus roseus]PWR03943.1 primosomal protein DnaI [Meridianimarinicoccus roseus]